MSKKTQSLDKCLNCSYEFIEGKAEKFCPLCGQKNADKRIGIFTLILDFLGDYFTFDSKLFRSLRHLFLTPGYLTDAFNSGKRVRYIPPLRMYIFISFLFFLTLRSSLSFIDTNQSLLEGQDVELTSDGERSSNDFQWFTVDSSTLVKYFDLESTLQIRPEHKEEFLKNFDSEIVIVKMGAETWYEKLLYREFGDVLKASRASMLDTALRNLPLTMFITMPIFAFLLFLFFKKSSKFYIEHLIHSIHLHTWVFILFLLLLLTGSSLNGLILSLFLITYEYLSVVYVYKQSYGRSALKVTAINLLYLIFLIFVSIILLFISLIQL